MTDGETYEGVPLEDLAINDIDWTHRGEYIRTRSKRKGPNEFDVEPEWATEAGLDPNRLVSTTGGKSVEVVGVSLSAPPRAVGDRGRVLKVWIVPKDPADLSSGLWWGASACDGNSTDRRDYRERGNE
jgi:hypothetical protein